MVTVEIKKGSTVKSIDCEFADITFNGTFFARFSDSRRLPKIAQEFDGIDSIKVIDRLLTKVYDGYSKLVYVTCEDGLVTIRLAKEAKGDD